MATAVDIAPRVADPTTQVVERNSQTGNAYIQSKQPGSAIAVQQVKEEAYADLGTVFDLKLANFSQTPVTVSAKNIAAKQGDRVLEVLGFEEAKRAIDARATGQQVFAVIGMLAGAAMGGMAARRGGPMAQQVISAAQQTIQMSAMAITKASENNAAFNSEASTVFLSETTVPPSNQTAGLFVVKDVSSTGGRIELVITIGDDRHVVHFFP